MHKMTTELAKMNRKKIVVKNELTFDMGEQMCYNSKAIKQMHALYIVLGVGYGKINGPRERYTGVHRQNRE